MDRSCVSRLLGVGLALAWACVVIAQSPAPAPKGTGPRVAANIDVLKGNWLRPDGGYGGSTYELTYDPASDRLKGTYYQAVAKQRFDVYFVRK